MSTADKITRIIGLGQARNLLEDMDREDAAAAVARETIAAMDRDTRRELALIELGHAVDRNTAEQARANGGLAKLVAEHEAVMSGRGPGCRGLERMEKKFWRFIAITISVPILIGLILAILGKF